MLESNTPYTFIPDPVCPNKWTDFKGNCYRVMERPAFISWIEAEDRCRLEDAHLVSIRDEEDMDFVHSLIIRSLTKGDTPPLNIYIGMYGINHIGLNSQKLAP